MSTNRTAPTARTAGTARAAGRTAARTAARTALAAVTVLAAGGAAVIGLPGTASAYVGHGSTLAPGQTACVEQYAAYQVRGEGNATRNGAKFRLRYYGSALATSLPGSTAWAAERRSAFGNFPGPGYYQVCATNDGAANTFVSFRILVDRDFA